MRAKEEALERIYLIATVIAVSIVLLILVYIYHGPELFETIGKLAAEFDAAKAREFVASYGIWAPLVFVLVQIFGCIVAPIPGNILMMSGGFLFGVPMGVALSVIGLFIGSLITFSLARVLGRPFVEKLADPEDLEAADKFFEEKGFYAVLIFRLIPVISLDLVSYGMGLTSMSFKDYVLATIIGMIPGAILYTLLGDVFIDVAPIIFFITTFVLVIAFLLTPFLKEKLFDHME